MARLFVLLLLVACAVALAPASFDFIESDQAGKVVLFGDSSAESTADVASILDGLQPEYADSIGTFYIVDKQDAGNEEIFRSFQELPVMFVVLPAEGIEICRFELTAENIADHLKYKATPAHEGFVQRFTSHADLVALSHQVGKPVFVKFFEQWCGHCQMLKPSFMKLAEALDDDYLFVEVECSASEDNQEFCVDQEVAAFPTLKLYGDGAFVRYEGGRTVVEMKRWLEAQAQPDAVAARKAQAQAELDAVLVSLEEAIASGDLPEEWPPKAPATRTNARLDALETEVATLRATLTKVLKKLKMKDEL
jgi:thiol-disulfide isomerase/thioredoxin